MNEYIEGTAITIPKTFLDENEQPVDPTDVSFFIRKLPSQTVTEYENGVDPEVTNPAVGTYVLSLPGTLAPGYYRARVAGTGVVEAADEWDFEIVGSATLNAALDAQPPGPCVPWIDGDAVAEVCDSDVGSSTFIFDQVAYAASEILYMLSGQQFPGQCSRVARPCSNYRSCSWVVENYVIAANPDVWWTPWGWEWIHDHSPVCGCNPLSQIPLSGYPVVSVEEVLIDGVAVDPDTYRVDKMRYLTRVTPLSTDQVLTWPACQRMELPPDQPGTMLVTYTAGVAPPKSGEMAAAMLACEIYKQITPGLDCALPEGVTQISRQGIVTTRQLGQWGLRNGQWSTGIELVDAFLQSYNPVGARERSSVWSPDLEPFAERV